MGTANEKYQEMVKKITKCLEIATTKPLEFNLILELSSMHIPQQFSI